MRKLGGRKGEDICDLVKALKHLSEDYPDVATPEIIKNLLDKALMIVESKHYAGNASDDIKEMQLRLSISALLLEYGLLENGDKSFTKAQLAQFNNAHYHLLSKFATKLINGQLTPNNFIDMFAYPKGPTNQQVDALSFLIDNDLFVETGVKNDKRFTMDQAMEIDPELVMLMPCLIVPLKQKLLNDQSYTIKGFINAFMQEALAMTATLQLDELDPAMKSLLLAIAYKAIEEKNGLCEKLEQVCKAAGIQWQDSSTLGIMSKVAKVISSGYTPEVMMHKGIAQNDETEYTQYYDLAGINASQEYSGNDPLTGRIIRSVEFMPELTDQLNVIILNLARDPHCYDSWLLEQQQQHADIGPEEIDMQHNMK